MILNEFQKYMGGRRFLLPLSVLLSGMSAFANLLPFLFIWFVVQSVFLEGSQSSISQINTYAWGALTSAIISVILYYLALSVSHLAAFRVEVNMRKRAMQRIIKLPFGFFDAHTTGEVRKVIDDNASITHGFLAHQLPDLAGAFITPFIVMILIFTFDWRLGLVCLVPIGISMVLLRTMMSNKGKQFMKLYLSSLEQMNTDAVEYVRGIPVVKVFQQTVFSFKKFHEGIIQYKNMVFAYTKMWEKPMSLYTVLINSFVFLLVPAAILLILQSGNYSGVLLNMFLYILITPLFSVSIMRIMYLNQASGQAKEALHRIEKLVSYPQYSIPPHPKSIKGHSISFSEVRFHYPGSNQNAVDGVNLMIPEGKKVAFVGPSGGGKTTMAKLVARFWDPDHGHVHIGGIDVKEIAMKELMSHITFVFQNTRLFHASILENVRYGKPSASVQEVENALEMAQCNDFVRLLPEGIDSVIGTGGTYLSGGEQQRVLLARAMLKNAPIVILDEATAFADPENEYLIQKALRTLTVGKTVLMIAHRLTSVQYVDHVCVIDQGKIVEQGTHGNLLALQGTYASMWKEYQQSVQWTLGEEVHRVCQN